ncbi:MAG: substrate-binding domain-containing protein, partial [Planctomycetota bacterium]
GDRVLLATPTSTENSGLLAEILPAFTAETGIEVDVLSMGTGKALATARRGDCDLVLVHAPAAELEFVRSGHGVERTAVMRNDFVLAGPAADPVGVRGRDAAAALRRIAAARAPFCSRADESGTHLKEKELWRAAGIEPAGGWYHRLGQGMGSTLHVAWELDAYVLTDRATYLQTRRAGWLEVLVAGDARLQNPYHVILVNPDRHPHVRASRARRLVAWLTGPGGQRRIARFELEGRRLFRPTARS